MPYPRITVDPRRMGGVACVRNSRMPVATVVALVAEGLTAAEIVAMHPDLQIEDVQEALRFAAEALQERAIPVPAGTCGS